MPTTEDRTPEAVAREPHDRRDGRDPSAVDELLDPQFAPGMDRVGGSEPGGETPTGA